MIPLQLGLNLNVTDIWKIRLDIVRRTVLDPRLVVNSLLFVSSCLKNNI